jgi:hypothetical protein
MTPIEAYPPKRYRGKPGYSAKYFAAMDGAPEDPLRVASRFQERAIGDQVLSEARLRLADGESFEAVLAWQGRTLTDRQQAAWEDLCRSWDELLGVLEVHQSEPGIARIYRQAKRDAKRCGR